MTDIQAAQRIRQSGDASEGLQEIHRRAHAAKEVSYMGLLIDS